ncbi:hypothetical protein [Sphingomonas bacterium]|uniref:hypothetical protein n=1 Tax=Sphingomonas bacterium TaxID=1895847 RepID=UPI001C2CD71C|nr:hypothetical protein [Sphingomonas bacterium]
MITIWYVGGFLLLLAGLIAGIGPTNTVQGWMSGHLGWDSPILAFIPAFAVLALPVVVLQLMPLQTGNPFVRGAQASLNPSRDPALTRRTVPDAVVAARLRRAGIVMLALAAAAIVTGLVAFPIIAPLPAHAGDALPRITARQVLAQAGAPSSHARLVGLSADARPVWVRYRSIRQTSYEDVYFPLDEPAPPAGGRTRLLGLASFVLGHGDAPHGREFVLDQPMDGAFARASLPAWQRAALAQRGISVNDPVLLFRQDRHLGGRYPGRDWIGGAVVLLVGGSAALVLLLMAASCLVRCRRLLAGASDRKSSVRHRS